jgi:hypothetical protein
MTPPATAKPTTPDGSYYNRNQNFMQSNAINTRPNNYYEIKSNADYSAYDMSASQQPNDLYSQAPAQPAVYQQQVRKIGMER